ncbi:nucleotidyltransferase domain-containing protein [Cohnella silvisoli]|uniref:Nucleotidyl transferase AbiEii/AbiGii toxin family protein n=1 Tax=Cohnella silvisoli TaxID=2873699 RepID=A0ABV1KN81_9BACL|nr:hypothetical protein [Cohnella silvisoli]MCD9021215.1 hypothetical protein [Cohnella silvisoli]
MQSDIPVSALALLAETLESCEARWVLGGSTALALRGARLERAPRDLDIYVDKESVSIIHDKLSQYAMDGPENNETERYHSILSHYHLAGSVVELVGDFRVSALQSLYTTEVSEFLFPNSDMIQVEGYKVPLVPLGHELIFNLLRERMDRASVVGELILRDPVKHLPLLQILLQRNHLSSDVAAEALRMTRAGSEDSNKMQEEPL